MSTVVIDRALAEGTSDFDNADVRLRQRALWDRNAARRSASVGELNAVTLRLLELGAVGEYSKVLDMACGAGDPTIAAAQIATRGQVHGLDISPAMVSAAREAARRADLHNTAFSVISDETVLDVPVGSVDVVLCRFGLMFMPEPAAALRAWEKTLKPGGRIVVCTHGGVPAFELTMRTVERYAPSVSARLEWRRVLALSSEDAMARSFADAGFRDVAVTRELAFEAATPDFGTCWDAMLSRSPLRDALDALRPAQSSEIRDACLSDLMNLGRSCGELFNGDVIYAVGSVAADGNDD